MATPTETTAVEGEGALASLPGIDRHPHARAVLGAALAPGGEPSHAYLFHGPPGSRKRELARAFAAALLMEGARSPGTVAERVVRDSHPDLTWVRPSGAAEMLVGDIEEAVVAAATRTPFESSRRVFVIERVEAMNDQAANRMLKTLEEPPPFVHLILLTDRREEVMPTIVSRCQQIRFDPPPPGRIAEQLVVEGVDSERAQACARLCLGDGELARRLAGEEGAALRGRAEAFARWALAGGTGTAAEGEGRAEGEGNAEGEGSRPWAALLELARSAGERAGELHDRRVEEELSYVAQKERRRYEREALEGRRRGDRRARTEALDLALRLSELWLRDVLCLVEGAGEVIYASDRREELEEDAAGRQGGPLRQALELLAATRLSLALNVSEELALDALAYRLESLLAA